MKKYLILLCFLFCSGSLFAQCGYCNYTVSQGPGSQSNEVYLANNTLSAICWFYVTACQIDWGDGNITNSAGLSYYHTYCHNGTYQITVSVWTSGFLFCTVPNIVTISCYNNYYGLHHTLNNNNANFIDTFHSNFLIAMPANCLWNFGDGNTLVSPFHNASHTYSNVGVFYPYLTTSYSLMTSPGSCLQTFTAIDTVIITCLPYNLSNNQNICIGSNYTFPDNTTYSNILSDTSHTSHFISALGCDSLITTHIHINPTYNQIENNGLCIGDNYTFHDGTVFSNITGNTSHVSYLTSEYGCDSNIVTNLSPLAVDKSIDQFNNTLAANEANASYQWLSCNPYTLLLGDTNQNYSATSNGEYAVIISKNGCVDTSSCYSVNSVSVNDFIKENQILVYPNPAKTILNIEIKNTNLSHSNMEATLCNTLGEVLLKEKIKPNGKAQFNVSTLSSGVYYIRCEGYSKKIIKE